MALKTWSRDLSLKLLPGNKTLLVLTQGGIVTTGKLIFPVLCQTARVIKPSWTIVIESNPGENHHLMSVSFRG